MIARVIIKEMAKCSLNKETYYKQNVFYEKSFEFEKDISLTHALSSCLQQAGRIVWARITFWKNLKEESYLRRCRYKVEILINERIYIAETDHIRLSIFKDETATTK